MVEIEELLFTVMCVLVFRMSEESSVSFDLRDQSYYASLALMWKYLLCFLGFDVEVLCGLLTVSIMKTKVLPHHSGYYIVGISSPQC